MAAGSYSFTIEMGTTVNKVLVWKDGQSVPQPIDNTGWSARMEVRPTLASTTINWGPTSSNGGLILGGSDGSITLHADATTTAAWTTGANAWVIPTGQTKPQGVYDLEMVDGSGNVIRLIQGTITLDPEVTRDP